MTARVTISFLGRPAKVYKEYAVLPLAPYGSRRRQKRSHERLLHEVAHGSEQRGDLQVRGPDLPSAFSNSLFGAVSSAVAAF